MNNKPIEIFVRHCYDSPNQHLPNRMRPEWFSKKLAWWNLLSTVDSKLANINVVYDYSKEPLDPYGGYCGQNECWFNFTGKQNAPPDVNVFQGGSESKSFLATLDIIESRNFPDDTIIYFLEDDYIHRRGWCRVLQEAFELPIRYATLYDHLDKYKDYPELSSKLFITPNSHWRQTPSTTNTFACKAVTLRADMPTQRFFSINTDNGISRDNEKFLELGRLGRTLVSAVPGWSTHCDAYMSPVIDWKAVIGL